MMPQKPIRILVVDNDEMVRRTLSDYLSAIQSFEVVGAVSNGREALEQTVLLHPQVVITELKMPVMDGIAATRQILQLCPNVAVILLSEFDELDLVCAGMDVGALCSVRKGDAMAELTHAIIQFVQSD